MSAPDLLIRDGLVFDGTGAPRRTATVVVREGRVERITDEPVQGGPDTVEIDAAGCWVTPGFIDMHTHYDAEVEAAPALSESLRHGVTSVVVGSCSLSLAVGTQRSRLRKLLIHDENEAI